MTSILNLNKMTIASTSTATSPKSKPRSDSITLPSISNLTASLRTSVSSDRIPSISSTNLRPSLLMGTSQSQNSLSLGRSPSTPTANYLSNHPLDSKMSFSSIQTVEDTRAKKEFQLPPLSSILAAETTTHESIHIPNRGTDEQNHDSSEKFSTSPTQIKNSDVSPNSETRPRYFSLPIQSARESNASLHSSVESSSKKDYSDSEDEYYGNFNHTHPSNNQSEQLAFDSYKEEVTPKVIYDPVLGKRMIGENRGHSNSSNNEAKEKRKRVVRRRTRTGCLTCRKRRIKCDERKPFCFNCEKSKKLCAGYEQVPYGSRRYRYMQQPKPQEIETSHQIIHQGPLPSPTSIISPMHSIPPHHLQNQPQTHGHQQQPGGQQRSQSISHQTQLHSPIEKQVQPPLHSQHSSPQLVQNTQHQSHPPSSSGGHFQHNQPPSAQYSMVDNLQQQGMQGYATQHPPPQHMVIMQHRPVNGQMNNPSPVEQHQMQHHQQQQLGPHPMQMGMQMGQPLAHQHQMLLPHQQAPPLAHHQLGQPGLSYEMQPQAPYGSQQASHQHLVAEAPPHPQQISQPPSQYVNASGQPPPSGLNPHQVPPQHHFQYYPQHHQPSLQHQNPIMQQGYVPHIRPQHHEQQMQRF
ncbi:hypothetical protein CANARDRAFT_59454 [[Candida] arabinofermentans NRRL YB-2248]|uniref:Zn(2)-C6 fungal-type domain-containing protein n=1 Tax=[Candida] arabinofermentans NRRL YB-2248 TaxID=983967 RepID=A0A1E4T960_9ASCO|nr:hypothetical protein CANARDRAFT_59454 [[Candida] arabinofermentans NRRL YB-2248]